MKVKFVTMFVAVRGSGNGERWDMTTLSWTEEFARKQAEALDAICPAWGERQPVTRIALIKITEVSAAETETKTETETERRIAP